MTGRFRFCSITMRIPSPASSPCVIYTQEKIIGWSGKRKAEKGILFLPKKRNKPAIILELKVDEDCMAALAQIKEKKYMQKAEEYADEVILAGISYDRTAKKHRCVMEKIEGGIHT